MSEPRVWLTLAVLAVLATVAMLFEICILAIEICDRTGKTKLSKRGVVKAEIVFAASLITLEVAGVVVYIINQLHYINFVVCTAVIISLNATGLVINMSKLNLDKFKRN